MNLRKTALFFVIIIALAAAAVVSYPLLVKGLKKNLGLDLQGGLRVVLQAKDTKGIENLDKAMDSTKEVIERRVNAFGISEPTVQREGDKRIVVELAGVKDPEAALDIIGKTAELKFIRADDNKVILTGKDLKDAQDSTDPATGGAIVSMEFTKEGSRKFAEATKDLVNKYPEVPLGTRNPKRYIGIYLDKDQLQNPYVKDVINTPRAQIDGYESLEEANKIAVLLRSGALPVTLDVIEKQTVGPTLGKDYLQKSLRAGLYGVAAILIFMIAYYRLPGLLANFTLAIYMFLVLAILVALSAIITLPGIAGFLLSIGMAVDANVIIYERLKEELRSGKTLRAAIDAGFKRAFTTILDSNVTTLIAAAVLAYFGTGPIRGFAITLSIGILSSMLTAITLTRWLLHLLAATKIVTNTKFYGA